MHTNCTVTVEAILSSNNCNIYSVSHSTLYVCTVSDCTCQMKEIVQVSIYYWPKELNVDVQGLNNIFYERNGCVVLNRSAFLCSINVYYTTVLMVWFYHVLYRNKPYFIDSRPKIQKC
jgi:hypothetical protein